MGACDVWIETNYNGQPDPYWTILDLGSATRQADTAQCMRTSEDVMPVTALLPRLKVRLAQLSNSFSMCSWMLEGSLVPSTLRSSSSEMKKNLQAAVGFSEAPYHCSVRYVLAVFYDMMSRTLMLHVGASGQGSLACPYQMCEHNCSSAMLSAQSVPWEGTALSV